MTNSTTLGKALPIKYGKARSELSGFVAESVPVYGSSGVIGEFNRALTTGPALIVGRKGSAGSVHYSATPCWPIDTVYYAETPPDSTLHYFKYLLERLRLGQHDKSTAIPSLGRDDYNAIPVSVPPREEQERVVTLLDEQLSRLDASVAALHRVQANLKRYHASVLKAACEGRLVPTEAELSRQEGRDFETGAQLLRRILSEGHVAGSRDARENRHLAPELTGLEDPPSGWILASAGQLLDRIEAGRSFRCEERPPVADEVGVLKVSAVTWSEFDEEESKTCVDEDKIDNRYMVSAGDFLFSRANTVELVGACVIVKHVRRRLMLSDKTLRFVVSGAVLAQWLLYCLRSRQGRKDIERLSTGNQESMRNIGQARIREIRVPLPPLAEQHRIVAEADRRLSLTRVAEAQVAANLARAQRLRQSMLQAAFSA